MRTCCDLSSAKGALSSAWGYLASPNSEKKLHSTSMKWQENPRLIMRGSTVIHLNYINNDSNRFCVKNYIGWGPVKTPTTFKQQISLINLISLYQVK